MHAADLAANLPIDSRCMRALEPALEWNKQDQLLAEAVNMLRLLVWLQSKDGQKGRNRPKPIKPPKLRAQSGTHTEKEGLSADEYKAQLSRARSVKE